MDPIPFQKSPSGRIIRALQGNYWTYLPNPLPPPLSWSSALVGQLSEADRALGKLDGAGRSFHNPHLLIVPFMRREAVLSSRIEGTRASLSDLYAYETDHTPLALASDVHEVYNYVRALEYGLARLDTLPLSLRLIRELHAHLMEGVRGERQAPGEFRNGQNWIGPEGCTVFEATYVPPPASEMLAALDAFERYLHIEPDLPPLIRLGLLHYQFEAIHPFWDGNGRVGRLLITLLLCTWKLLNQPLLYLSAYFAEHRQVYYDLLLNVSRAGAWEEWLIFFLRGVSEQAHDAVARAERLQDLREGYRKQFQAARKSARLLEVIDLLFIRPILQVDQIETTLEVSTPAAQNYLDHLVAAGVLHEITGRARNRVYRADAVLEALEAPLPAK